MLPIENVARGCVTQSAVAKVPDAFDRDAKFEEDT
jgi:hypothetical protein